MVEFLFLFLFQGFQNIVYIKKMAEQNERDKYIKCKGCKCKYINDEEHVKHDFGYNILGETLKTCVNYRSIITYIKKHRSNKLLILM